MNMVTRFQITLKLGSSSDMEIEYLPSQRYLAKFHQEEQALKKQLSEEGAIPQIY